MKINQLSITELFSNQLYKSGI